MKNPLIILLLCLLGSLWAQTPEKALADSVMQQRNLEILEEYGIKETSTLTEVAEILKVSDFGKFKKHLGLEPENQVLDNRNLRQLSLRPYDVFLASQTLEYGFSELNTLAEVSNHLHIPIKKLKSMLGEPFDPLSSKDDHRSLQSLMLDPERILQVKGDFRGNLLSYGWVLTLIGMLVVFSALLITSIVISQLIHLNAHKKKEIPVIKVSSSGKVIKSSPNASQDIIVAAITALFIYENTIKERRRIQLTFNRTKTNQWRSSSMLQMPNREFFQKRS
ncbi:MAG TPA: OadG family protein [Candidatus Cloacimonadota bacterium]|nr:OadG family protein [Candidatus Cloacimonadota bacterium]